MNLNQCQAARALLGWTCEDLAEAAGIGVATVWRFEAGDNVRDSSIDAIQKALEDAGIQFIPENGGGPGVRLK